MTTEEASADAFLSVMCNAVFSTWKTTLDIVQAGLENAEIKHLRFDRKVAERERQKVVDRFRSDSSVVVLLLTLSYHAVG